MSGPEGEARLERLRLLAMAVSLCFLFLVVTALVLAPVFHYALHRFHWEADNTE